MTQPPIISEVRQVPLPVFTAFADQLLAYSVGVSRGYRQTGMNPQVYGGVLAAYDFHLPGRGEDVRRRTFVVGIPGIPTHRHEGIGEPFEIVGVFGPDGTPGEGEAYLIDKDLNFVRLKAGMTYHAESGTWHGFEIVSGYVVVRLPNLTGFTPGDLEIHPEPPVRQIPAHAGGGESGAWKLED